MKSEDTEVLDNKAMMMTIYTINSRTQGQVAEKAAQFQLLIGAAEEKMPAQC